MKKQIVYLFFVAALAVISCKGTTASKGSDTSTDSGQTHVSAAGPADSNKYPASPVETGGQDTSGSGTGTPPALQDTTNNKKHK
jgi:hypothetical protein